MTATSSPVPPTTSATQTWSRFAIARRLLRFGRPLWGTLAASTTFRIVQMSLGIWLFALGAVGVGRVLDGGTSTTVAPLLWQMAGIAFAKGVVRYLEQFLGHKVAFTLLALLRDDFYRKVEPQAPAGLQDRHTGDLLARVMKDIDRVEVFYAHTIAPATAALIVPLLWLVGIAVVFSPILALTLLPFLLGVGLLVPLLSNRAAASAATDLRVARGSISQHLTDGIQGIREVLAFGYGPGRVAELEVLGDDAGAAHTTMGRLMAVRRGLNEALVGGGFVATLLVGVGQVNAGALTWVDLTVVLAISLPLFAPVLGVEEFIADLEQSFASARRLWDVTDREPAVLDPTSPDPGVNLLGTIAFEDVRFTYPGRDGDLAVPAVDGVTFSLPAGQRIAVVGASGSGKSTLVSLLLRFWDVDEGRVLVGGHDVRDLSLLDLRAHIAVVDQRTYLFNASIADNLRIARPDASDAELIEVCRQASLHETILAMPQGYDTMVGEMGERLSGGQRQRLAIARALLKDAPVLVLDEATSDLDVETEAEIGVALEALAEGRTTLVIAHRLNTVRNADTIIAMDRGRIAQVGTHAELLAAGGVYATLWARHATDLDVSLT